MTTDIILESYVMGTPQMVTYGAAVAIVATALVDTVVAHPVTFAPDLARVPMLPDDRRQPLPACGLHRYRF